MLEQQRYKGGIRMSEEMKREIIKAFAHKMPVDLIAQNTGLSKDEVVKFADDYKELIADEMTYNIEKVGE